MPRVKDPNLCTRVPTRRVMLYEKQIFARKWRERMITAALVVGVFVLAIVLAVVYLFG